MKNFQNVSEQQDNIPFVFMVIGVLIAAVLGLVFFILIGYVVSLIFNWSLFNATALSVGATLVVLLCLSQVKCRYYVISESDLYPSPNKKSKVGEDKKSPPHLRKRNNKTHN